MTRHAITILVAATLLAAGAARAKEAPPPAAPPKPFTLPSHHDFELDNGAKVTLVPYGTVPKATITLMLRGGNAAESEQQVWLADMTARSLREGTKTKTAGQLAEAAAEMGGDLDASAQPEATVISIEVLSEFAPRAIALVADVARNPAFPADDVARVKADLLRQLAISRTQPGMLALEQFESALYPDHPFGRTFPTEAMLNGYTVDEVRDFYAKTIGAARAHLYVAGKFDSAAVEKAAREALGDWARGP
jgi:predicted Zn-dependent peptidase